MKTELSILIPTYNCRCVDLVRALNEQAQRLRYINYEIVVADDGSTDERIKTVNACIDVWPNCRYVARESNLGRSAIRNFLSQTARYSWLLFIDSNVQIISNDFLKCYLSTDGKGQVICGGIAVGDADEDVRHCLRYLYERRYMEKRPLNRRRQYPYQSFRTTNFMVDRDVIRTFPFCEEMRNYGYEDVLWGKYLQQNGIQVTHIYNPVAYFRYDDNAAFIAKTEEALDTLAAFRNQLRGYSPLLTMAEWMQRYGFASLFLALFRYRQSVWRQRLCGKHPSVFLFNLYRLGYLLIGMGAEE